MVESRNPSQEENFSFYGWSREYSGIDAALNQNAPEDDQQTLDEEYKQFVETINEHQFDATMIADEHLRLLEVTRDGEYFSQATDAFFQEIGIDSIFVSGNDFSTGKL